MSEASTCFTCDVRNDCAALQYNLPLRAQLLQVAAGGCRRLKDVSEKVYDLQAALSRRSDTRNQMLLLARRGGEPAATSELNAESEARLGHFLTDLGGAVSDIVELVEAGAQQAHGFTERQLKRIEQACEHGTQALDGAGRCCGGNLAALGTFDCVQLMLKQPRQSIRACLKGLAYCFLAFRCADWHVRVLQSG